MSINKQNKSNKLLSIRIREKQTNKPSIDTIQRQLRATKVHDHHEMLEMK